MEKIFSDIAAELIQKCGWTSPETLLNLTNNTKYHFSMLAYLKDITLIACYDTLSEQEIIDTSTRLLELVGQNICLYVTEDYWQIIKAFDNELPPYAISLLGLQHLHLSGVEEDFIETEMYDEQKEAIEMGKL